MRIVAGVDCHKDSHSIAFVDSVGKLIESLTVGTAPADIVKAISAARVLGDVVWGLESTGCYGSIFAQTLNASGYTVYEVPGSYTKRHRKHASRLGKSDPIDAQAIAEVVLRECERLPLYRFSAQREAIKLRYDQRDRLVRERTKTINRLRSAALRLGLQDLPTSITTQRALENLSREVQKQRGMNDAIDALVDEALYAIEDIVRVDRRIREIERVLGPLMRRIAPELLEIHGISTVTAAGFVGHSGDLANCRNADAFAMRCGAAPVPCASGKRQGVRVNSGGNRQLNRLLYSTALVQLRAGDHVGRKYYERKRSEGKTTKSAIRCLKRQLSRVVYYRLVLAHGRLLSEQSPIAA